MITSPHSQLHVGVCGSTAATVMMAEALEHDPRFSVDWVVSPSPRPVGRKQVLTPSPLETWARDLKRPVLTVDRSLKEIQAGIVARCAEQPIDFLLVVDFGYLVPQWMLDLPRRAPVNIHPSDLPKYRGSSPGQFAILSGETESAVCIMHMDAGLDTGPIIARLPLRVEPRATAASYYSDAFQLAKNALPDTLFNFSPADVIEQKNDSAVSVTPRLDRQTGYIPYSMIEHALHSPSTLLSPTTEGWSELSPVLQRVVAHQPNLRIATLIDRACRAFHPWPGIWTLVPHYKGQNQVRCKLLTTEISENTFAFTQLQYAGETAKIGHFTSLTS